MTPRHHCPICGWPATPASLAEASWLPPAVLQAIARKSPGWRLDDGACPSCVHETLLDELKGRGEGHEAALGVLPTPVRMRADARWAGRGVVLALVDSGFSPHPDLVRPVNRIVAWADSGEAVVRERFYAEEEEPAWPGSDRPSGPQWHGLMTSAVAAGSGWLSHGLYRGLASEARLVLVAARDAATGRITNATIARALRWLRGNAGRLGLDVVSISLGGDELAAGERDIVDDEVSALVSGGVAVIAAAGNDGQRRLVPPASSPLAITVGGLDDRNTFDPAELALWHSNYGEAASGAEKPELVAPGIWVAAPLLPGTVKAKEAQELFALRNRPEAPEDLEGRIAAMKFVTPHYHHVDGTSVSAPLVAAVVACMKEANPRLAPAAVRRLLCEAARPVPGEPRERQGAGALDAGRALALAAGASADSTLS